MSRQERRTRRLCRAVRRDRSALYIAPLLEAAGLDALAPAVMAAMTSRSKTSLAVLCRLTPSSEVYPVVEALVYGAGGSYIAHTADMLAELRKGYRELFETTWGQIVLLTMEASVRTLYDSIYPTEARESMLCSLIYSKKLVTMSSSPLWGFTIFCPSALARFPVAPLGADARLRFGAP